MNRFSADPQAAIAAQAAEWVICMDANELKANNKRELLSWLRMSPQHIDEFLLAAAMWRELDDLQQSPRLEVEQLVAEARQNIVVLNDRKPRIRSPRKSYNKRLVGLFASAALVILGIGLWFSHFNQHTTFETAIGEQLTFTLADGSIIHLNTSSVIEVDMTQQKRSINLVRGEALFQVARDPDRPFRVQSGSALVAVLGTQFNVYRRAAGTSVTVVEGRVSVESNQSKSVNNRATLNIKPLLLSAGQEARVDNAGIVAPVVETDIEKNMAWRHRRLIFRGDTFSEVAAEFNRYNQTKILIKSPNVLTRKITATFNADDPESFAMFLDKDPAIKVTRRHNQIVIDLNQGLPNRS